MRAGWFVVLSMIATCSVAAEPVQFNRDVRPILSDKCFACHGPDSANRAADLRLDVREIALKPASSDIAAIVPGQPEGSLLFQRITAESDDEVMPPPHAKLGRLTATEIDVLRRWIAAGAEYQPHWAFLPVEPVALPAVPTDFPTGIAAHNEIDHIVFAGLRDRSLSPQLIAERHTLIRRLFFDLTGLPPSPAEITAFVADNDPQAYENLVDRLLKSPHYGERMAADWLDVARYADSYGFQVDRERDMWPYRDWVIHAFNQNLPWDQFVTWQLAGDLLPQPTNEQRLATAFNRLHQQEAEGGSVEEEYRVNYVNDRVVTFGTAFLGLTLECCRCHDHKFDPITQREYYQFFAFFDDIDEAGLYSFFTSSAPTPTMWLLNEQQKKQQAEAIAKCKAAEAVPFGYAQSREAAIDDWLASRPVIEGPIPGEVLHLPFEERNAEGKFPSLVGENLAATSPGENTLTAGKIGEGLLLTGDHAVTTTVGNFHRYEPFTVSLWLQTPDMKDRAVIFHRSRAWTDAASRGYELLLIDGRLQWSLIHFWPGDAVSIQSQSPLPTREWVHVTVSSDGSGRASGLRIFINGQLAETNIIRDHLQKDITGGGGDSIAIGERFRDRGFKGGLVDEFRVWNRALTDLEIAEVYAPGSLAQATTTDLTGDQQSRWQQFYLARFDETYAKLQADLLAERKALSELADSAREIMVMEELAEPKTAYILKRGEYNLRGDPVTPGTPASLLAFPANQPRNRLGLARWLTNPQHPLLARVTVNRVWQSLFGRGLVKTAEDFGSQSERPEYPELIDWLAGRFIASGWDMKDLIKTIVMSHTYQQRSLGSATVMADDPENLWLARGPRFRLPAEMIRDNALIASGLLVDKFGGPPVRTYDMPESFKPSNAGTGEQLYRRSLYTFWRRTGPAPMLEVFDVPKRQVCTARRDITNTPLHAFVLLNGPQFIEAARVLAETLSKEHAGDPAAMLSAGSIRLIGREPDASELAILQRMYDRQLAWYREHSTDAAALVKIGEKPIDPALPVIEIAAWTNVINALMNHDECVVKR
ncbi:DUF1553 domain-containing protein [bacterium]|nr:DUF1553 domain-containing protein [bacterium]